MSLKILKALLMGLFLFESVAFGFDHNHSKWAEILKRHTHVLPFESKMDYTGIARDRETLDLYLRDVERVSANEYGNWSRSQKLAFLINAHNAFAIKNVLNHFQNGKPPTTLSQNGDGSKIGQEKFFKLFGQPSNLDRIEDDLALKQADDPSVRLAFNSGTAGGPNLYQEAFLPDRLDRQLADVKNQFMNDPNQNFYDAKTNTLKVSPLFKRHGADFDKSAKTGSLRQFLASSMSLPDDVKQKVREGKVNIEFGEDNWKLNSQ